MRQLSKHTFSAYSAAILCELCDLRFCFFSQNLKAQRPPRTPAEAAEKSRRTTRPSCNSHQPLELLTDLCDRAVSNARSFSAE